MISEMNNTSVKWAKGDFARQAFAMYPDNKVLKFIVEYMNMQHQKQRRMKQMICYRMEDLS